MGLEKDPPIEEKPQPPFFSGKAIQLRFPNIIFVDPKTNQQISQRVEFITFPKWVHKVQIDDKIYEILGEDLQIGMPIVMTGQIFTIVDIKEQLYHGVINPQNHPMGYMKKDWNKIPKYRFRRVIKNDEDRWVAENINEELKLATIKDEYLNTTDFDILKRHYQTLRNEYDELWEKYSKLKELIPEG